MSEKNKTHRWSPDGFRTTKWIVSSIVRDSLPQGQAFFQFFLHPNDPPSAFLEATTTQADPHG